jgi:hypothetical protein
MRTDTACWSSSSSTPTAVTRCERFFFELCHILKQPAHGTRTVLFGSATRAVAEPVHTHTLAVLSLALGALHLCFVGLRGLLLHAAVAVHCVETQHVSSGLKDASAASSPVSFSGLQPGSVLGPSRRRRSSRARATASLTKRAWMRSARTAASERCRRTHDGCALTDLRHFFGVQLLRVLPLTQQAAPARHH